MSWTGGSSRQDVSLDWVYSSSVSNSCKAGLEYPFIESQHQVCIRLECSLEVATAHTGGRERLAPQQKADLSLGLLVTGHRALCAVQFLQGMVNNSRTQAALSGPRQEGHLGKPVSK